MGPGCPTRVRYLFVHFHCLRKASICCPVQVFSTNIIIHNIMCTLYGVLTFGNFAKENGSQKQHAAFEKHHLDYFKHVLDEHQ